MSITIYEPAPTPTDEPARERAVRASGALDVRDDAALQALVMESCRQLQAGMAAVSILYQDWQYMIAVSGVMSRTNSRRTSLCGHAIITPRSVFYVGDLLADERFADNPVLIDGQQVRFYAGAPLLDADHMPLGTLCVFDRAPRPRFDAYDRMRLQELAALAMARLAELRAG